jgi:hypothetical protein
MSCCDAGSVKQGRFNSFQEVDTMRHATWQTIRFAALVCCGCAGREAETDGKASDAAPAASSPEHAHGAGPHGGVVADWGGGKYHVEFSVDHDRHEATIHVLGDDAATPAAIRADNMLLSIDEPRFQVPLDAAPLEGESKDACSRFIAHHDNLGQVREFSGTISGTLDGTPYAGDFSEHAHEHP